MRTDNATLVKRIITILLASAALLSLLCGCASGVNAADIEKNALKYYRNKYDLKDVTVVSSFKAGNSGLFGYLSVTDMAYVMSDGSSVYWNDSEKKFYDNAQSDQITGAFRLSVLAPLLAELEYPLKMTDCDLNRTGFESFDECVFNTLYSGDITAFLKKELPELSGLTVAIETDDTEACEKDIESLYGSLRGLVTGWAEVFILSGGLDGLEGGSWYPDYQELNVTVRAGLNFRPEAKKEISWYRMNYIEVYDGIYVTSAKDDFVLEEGDIVFEQAGTCADLQKMIDEGYDAMPVDAEENMNGGYMKKDRRHESRAVLDDTSLPLFSIKMSQRVIDELDYRNCISVLIIDRRDDGQPLMMYYGKNSTVPYRVYQVCERGLSYGEYAQMNPDYLYYFGTHQYAGYGE